MILIVTKIEAINEKVKCNKFCYFYNIVIL
jgi:hypothetical protein